MKMQFWSSNINFWNVSACRNYATWNNATFFFWPAQINQHSSVAKIIHQATKLKKNFKKITKPKYFNTNNAFEKTMIYRKEVQER